MRLIPAILTLGIVLCLSAISAFSQDCGTDAFHQYRMQTDSAYAARIQQQTEAWANYQTILSNSKIIISPTDTIYEMPVVFHVVHRGEAVGDAMNPSDAQINKLLDYVNKSFAAQWGAYPGVGSGGVKVPIRFKMAQHTPDCQPSNGIHRIDGRFIPNYEQYGVSNGPGNGTNMGKLYYYIGWPHQDNYNIYLVHTIEGDPKGFAAYPNGDVDGTVMELDYAKEGEIVLVHELGHALDLRHTFEGDSNGTVCPVNKNCRIDGDGICDTEPHNRNFTSCINGVNPCTGTTINNTDLNFMSYSRICHDRFTPDQKARMVYTIQNEPLRPELLRSEAVNPPLATLPTCSPVATDTVYHFGFGGVELEELNHFMYGGDRYNDVSCHGYASLYAGGTHKLELNGIVSGQMVRVYIDFNDDGNFAGANEMVSSGAFISTISQYSTFITIPATGMIYCKKLRMRVVTDTLNGIFPGPCTNVKTGQVKDYAVVLRPLPTSAISIKQTLGTNPTCPDSTIGFTATITGATSYKLYWEAPRFPIVPGGTVFNYNTHRNKSIVRAMLVTRNPVCDYDDVQYSNVDTIYHIAGGKAPTISRHGDTLISDVYPVHWYRYPNDLVAANATTHLPVKEGRYFARNVSTGCPSDASNYIHSFPVGISYNAIKKSLSIYPNPANQSCTFSVAWGTINRIHITSSLGQTIATTESAAKEINIDTHTWAPGLYMATIEYENGAKEVEKIVIAR